MTYAVASGTLKLNSVSQSKELCTRWGLYPLQEGADFGGMVQRNVTYRVNVASERHGLFLNYYEQSCYQSHWSFSELADIPHRRSQLVGGSKHDFL